MQTIEIVVPTHNCAHWLGWCLKELFDKTDFPLIVTVVDDRSNFDESNKIEQIVGLYKEARLIKNISENGGFGYACNLGAKSSEADVLLFLNTDCFITKNSIRNLLEIFSDENVALACPISNNSPELSYSMWPGRSYIDMAEIIEKAFNWTNDSHIYEACTVVGNCLAVRKSFFIDVNGFSDEWGVGYGEETDLHMKAYEKGLKGVVSLKSYVYHYGSGTFALEKDIEKHKKKNHSLFMSRWNDEYNQLSKIVAKKPPINALDICLRNYFDNNKQIPILLDVVFYLPGIDQSIGGIHAVVALCNELIKNGIKACCALVGLFSAEKLKEYKEPVLFNFLYYMNDNDFLSDNTVISKLYVSTIFTSAEIVKKKAFKQGVKNIQFIQGYECYFENGRRYFDAKNSFSNSDKLIVTTDWLKSCVSKHLESNQNIVKLGLVVNHNMFYSVAGLEREYDVCVVLRDAADKGQWKILDILHALNASGLSVLVIYADKYKFIRNEIWNSYTFFELPIDQYQFSKLLRKCKVFLDASLHEGFGLMPYEAGLCGCNLVITNSGGVEEFSKKFNTTFYQISDPPEKIVGLIKSKTKAFNNTVSTHHDPICAWIEFIKSNIDESIIDSNKFYQPQTLQNPSAKINNRLYKIVANIYRKIRPYISNELHAYFKSKIKK